jgi:hypothetical protein
VELATARGRVQGVGCVAGTFTILIDALDGDCDAAAILDQVGLHRSVGRRLRLASRNELPSVRFSLSRRSLRAECTFRGWVCVFKSRLG